MKKMRLKKIWRIGWELLVILIWGVYLYEILFTANSQDYGVKEWGLFGALTLTVGFQLWSLFNRSKKPEKVESENG